MKKILLFALLFSTALPALAHVDIRVLEQGVYVSLDTFILTIDTNDNSGTGANSKIVFFNVYNLSATDAEDFYVEAEWLCSNSSTSYQFCQSYPPDYTSGTCHTIHSEGTRVYDGYDYSIPPDTCNYNYLECHFFIYDYSVEKEHEKVCRFNIKRRNTHELLDSMYLIIRRGNLPCYQSQPVTGMNSVLQQDDVADIYPNPACSNFTIAAKQGQLISYSLYAPDGKIISDKHTENRKSFNINVGDLANGIYYVKLMDTNGRSFYKKIVVNH